MTTTELPVSQEVNPVTQVTGSQTAPMDLNFMTFHFNFNYPISEQDILPCCNQHQAPGWKF